MIKLENEPYGKRLSFSHYHSDSLNYAEHMHRNFEIVFCSRGQLQVMINQKYYVLSAGEVVLILPYHAHKFKSIGSSYTDIFIFSPEYIEDFYTKMDGFTLESPIIELEKDTFDSLYEPIFKTDSTFYRKAAVYFLIYLFEKNTECVKLKKNQQLTTKILYYIEKHFQENLTLDDLSEYLGFSSVYISKIISTKLDSSFPILLNTLRINHACYLLTNTEESISGIAKKSGFQNTRTFNRNFQINIGHTPQEYRKNAISIK